MIVVSEIGDIWSPHTAPARTAATARIIIVSSDLENIFTTIGTRIAKVPQLVPDENPMNTAIRKMITGTNLTTEGLRFSEFLTKSPSPSASVVPLSVQARTRISMAGIMSFPPSGTEFMKSLNPMTLLGR